MLKNCPIAGYEEFLIEYPDELLVEHQHQYAAAVMKAFEDHAELTEQEARFYGAKGLCSRFEGAPDLPVKKWPLAVFSWFMNLVYYDLYHPAINPPKN